MIQWFPGHMAKALRQIEEQKKIVDLFVIVLDSRAPLSCYNPEFDRMLETKLKLFVLSKIDLADPEKIAKLTPKFPINHGVIGLNLKKQQSYKKLMLIINKLLKEKKIKDQKKGILNSTLKLAVIGVPNVGKSTLINLLAKKNKTKVANIPGVTRGKQWINTGNLLLLDTPGVLWPKIADPLVGLKLALIGLIKDSIINQTELLYHGYALISKMYPHKITQINLKNVSSEQEIYQQIKILCQNKHYFLKNGEIDLNRGITYLLNYFKNLSQITYD